MSVKNLLKRRGILAEGTHVLADGLYTTIKEVVLIDRDKPSLTIYRVHGLPYWVYGGELIVLSHKPKAKCKPKLKQFKGV